jgi:hypothetical protein
MARSCARGGTIHTYAMMRAAILELAFVGLLSCSSGGEQPPPDAGSQPSGGAGSASSDASAVPNDADHGLLQPDALCAAEDPFDCIGYGCDCPRDRCRVELYSSRASCGSRSCENPLCTDFPASCCPKAFCMVAKSCTGQMVCTWTNGEPIDVSDCGELNEAGHAECCPGLVERCGVLAGNGQCSALEFPVCLACGDGTCEGREDRCNCPEDCQ